MEPDELEKIGGLKEELLVKVLRSFTLSRRCGMPSATTPRCILRKLCGVAEIPLNFQEL